MKNLYILFVVFISTISFSQIPNGSFEEWEQIDSLWYPKGNWITNQGWNYTRFERSEENVEGEFALKFLKNESSSAMVAHCNGFLQLVLNFPRDLESDARIEFSIKEIPSDTIGQTSFYLGFSASFEGEVINRKDWVNNELLFDFKKVSILISDSLIDRLWLLIRGGGISSDLDACYAPSTVWLDDLKLITTTPISETIEIEYQFFPNPTRSVININSDYLWTKVNVYSDLGQLLKSFDSREEIDISELKADLYYLDIEWRNGGRTRERVIKM